MIVGPGELSSNDVVLRVLYLMNASIASAEFAQRP